MQTPLLGEKALPVTVVIVTFNSSHVIKACLESIPPHVSVCLVDNASADNSIFLAESVRPNIQVIKNRLNLGFGKAMNLGISQSGTEFVLLLNPDTRLAEGAVEALVSKARDYPDAAILSPVLYHPSGEQQSSYRSSAFKSQNLASEYIEPAGDLCAEMLSGAVMLWRMEHMQNIGLFDERFFFAYEDADICMRVTLAGKSLVVVPSAAVMHESGASTPPSVALTIKKSRYAMTSKLCFEQKYKGRLAARRMALSYALKYFLRTALYLPLLYRKGVLRSYGRFQAAFTFLMGSAQA